MALLVYDMQVGIVNRLRDGRAIVAKVKEVLEAAREGGFPVCFSRHLSLPKADGGLPAPAGEGREGRGRKVSLPAGRAAHGDLARARAAREAVCDKIAMSAFSGTFPDVALRHLGINSFAICGIATEVGIGPTARDGANLGYVPVVVEDACGAGCGAGRRSPESPRFAGDASFTDAAEIGGLFRRGTGSQAAP